jgi:hypothetical protein
MSFHKPRHAQPDADGQNRREDDRDQNLDQRKSPSSRVFMMRPIKLYKNHGERFVAVVFNRDFQRILLIWRRVVFHVVDKSDVSVFDDRIAAVIIRFRRAFFADFRFQPGEAAVEKLCL